ncbi:MAG TPA: zinc ribbon domain-containing protein [Chloroflexota bacterium]|nr:zinc ribbon domain-containing protein [Chloroflexota bacterium]
MPLYDFRCPACQATFEQRVPLAALGQAVACPRCGAATAERLVSLPVALVRGATSASAPAPMPMPTGGA